MGEDEASSAEADDPVRAAAERIVELEEEVEASGVAHVEPDAVARAKAVLHAWVDEITGVVISPGVGRVSVIHGRGRPSTIASADLPFRMSEPVGKRAE